MVIVPFFSMEQKPKILVIVGPTASGKSTLAVKLAKRFDGEVISADSRQVYRGMDIGTGKITQKEMCGIPHHLLSVASPKNTYTASDYVRDAKRAMRSVLRRHKLPIICGGTGFYVSALVDGLTLPDAPPDPTLRKRLEGKSVDELFERLRRLDPVTASRIDRRNPRRLIRAIEIARTLGKVPSLVRNTHYNPLFIGVTLPKEELNLCIHQRLIARMNQGMLDEVRKLIKSGVSVLRMEELGLEYRFCARHLNGLLTKEELLTQLEYAIKQYAKRQHTWFRKEKRIHWVGQDAKKTKYFVQKFLQKTL